MPGVSTSDYGGGIQLLLQELNTISIAVRFSPNCHLADNLKS